MTPDPLAGLELRLLDPTDEATVRQLVTDLAREWGTSTDTELWLHTGEAHRFYTRSGYTVVEPKASVDTDAVLYRPLTP